MANRHAGLGKSLFERKAAAQQESDCVVTPQCRNVPYLVVKLAGSVDPVGGDVGTDIRTRAGQSRNRIAFVQHLQQRARFRIALAEHEEVEGQSGRQNDEISLYNAWGLSRRCRGKARGSDLGAERNRIVHSSRSKWVWVHTLQPRKENLRTAPTIQCGIHRNGEAKGENTRVGEIEVGFSERARLSPLGDNAVVVTLGHEISVETNLRVKALANRLSVSPPDGMVEYVPAFTTVTIVYDATTNAYDEFAARVRDALASVQDRPPESAAREVVVPVCYGGEFGPDLPFVASHCDLSEDEVVRIHCEPAYLVYMIGFAPGFPYLGGMSERIAAPRRDTPRERIPAGSVGIAGKQTGVYSIETPGGWRVIGRTPVRVFAPEHDPPSLLRPGDRVRFEPIERDDYDTRLAGAQT
jgi:inhibitor of KinA